MQVGIWMVSKLNWMDDAYVRIFGGGVGVRRVR